MDDGSSDTGPWHHRCPGAASSRRLLSENLLEHLGRGTTLNADCKTFNQQSIRTSLPYFASCVGDIGNINGTLACAGPNCLHREARSCERASGLGRIGSKTTTINEPRRSGEGLAMIGATECGPQLKPGTYDRKAPPTERS